MRPCCMVQGSLSNALWWPKCVKSRDIILLTKVHRVTAVVFPVVVYICESCIIKKVKCQRVDAFEPWCWRRLLRVPWTARRSKQINLKGNQLRILTGRTDAEAPYFGHLIRTANSLEKSLMLGKIKGRRRRGYQRMRWLHAITDAMDVSLSKLWKIVKGREAWHYTAVHGISKSQTQLGDWTAAMTNGKEIQKRGDACTYTEDALCSTVETSTTL